MEATTSQASEGRATQSPSLLRTRSPHSEKNAPRTDRRYLDRSKRKEETLITERRQQRDAQAAIGNRIEQGVRSCRKNRQHQIANRRGPDALKIVSTSTDESNAAKKNECVIPGVPRSIHRNAEPECQHIRIR